MQAARTLGFRTDLALLRLGGSAVTDRGDHFVVRTPHNPTFWWGNFLLLRSIPENGAEWVERFAVEFPDASHIALGVDVPDAGVEGLAWFTDHGFAAHADVVLTGAGLTAPGRSVDAECRPFVTDDDWAQSVRLNLIGHEPDDVTQPPFVRARVATHRELARAGHGAWFGAFVDGRLVAELGIVRAGDGLARYQEVLTDPQFRRRGYATALLVTAERHARSELDARTVVIVADPSAPAFELYRAIGFVPRETQVGVQRSATRVGE